MTTNDYPFMKKFFALCIAFCGLIQSADAFNDFFTPVRNTELRAPAVPLLTSDPFFSIWSPSDCLYDRDAVHWSGSEKPLSGAVRVDGEVYRFMGEADSTVAAFSRAAVQKSVDVMPTQTYYTFACGPVELDIVFTAPLLPDDLDLLSAPVNYVSYRVRSTDRKSHSVQFYLEVTPWMAVNTPDQPTAANAFSEDGLSYLRCGTIEQAYTEHTGDGVGIDWGYLYLAGRTGSRISLSLGGSAGMKEVFAATGHLLPGSREIVNRDPVRTHAMAYSEDLGNVDRNGRSGFMMIGYDDIYCVEYMFRKQMAYWKHGGEASITDVFGRAASDYDSVMRRCREFDELVYSDGEKAGGRKYAELLSLAYRQVIAAHKLFTDEKGNLLFFSKENGSNGCINTVDLTYPSAPLFLVYNTDLLKGMMTSIFEYSASGRWNKPFPAHDLGKYPKANGQIYDGDMPVEEGGNMLVLAAAISKADGNASYAARYWNLLTVWADYLVKYGQDPENQLCTDDFAGHWAHNANLSAKAIMGIAGYSEMARMLGMEDTADRYMDIARRMAEQWKKDAADGDHYRLAFDRAGTWSQKYNMVWDKLWGLGLFTDVMEKEIPYYLTKQNRYGLPLDCRKEYTKSDWIMWIAAMAPDRETMDRFVEPVYDFADESPTRQPLGDWHESVSGDAYHFRARSVIGGYWMPVLMSKN